MNIKLNNRLTKISDFIFSNDSVIDIGCDHGLLGIYLYLKKNVKKMVSSDVNELPLNKAKENIEKYNLTQKIEVRLGNGLECLSNEIDTIVISGMGGLTINQILKDIKKYSNIKKIVISPNTDFYKTRKVITKLGFYLEEETIVKEHNKYYLISCYIKGKGSKINCFFGKLDLHNKDVLSYYLDLVIKNRKINKSLSFKYIFKKVKLLIINILIKIKLNDIK